MERSALALTAQRVPVVPLIGLEDNLVVQERAAGREDYEAFFDSDQLCHRMLAGLSGCEGFGRIADTARAHLDRVRWLSLPELTYMQHLVVEHRSILDHLVAGEPEAADELLRAHLRSVLQVLPVIYDRYPGYFVAEEDDQQAIEIHALRVARSSSAWEAASPDPV